LAHELAVQIHLQQVAEVREPDAQLLRRRFENALGVPVGVAGWRLAVLWLRTPPQQLLRSVSTADLLALPGWFLLNHFA
jgi:hypothetical protein